MTDVYRLKDRSLQKNLEKLFPTFKEDFQEACNKHLPKDPKQTISIPVGEDKKAVLMFTGDAIEKVG